MVRVLLPKIWPKFEIENFLKIWVPIDSSQRDDQEYMVFIRQKIKNSTFCSENTNY